MFSLSFRVDILKKRKKAPLGSLARSPLSLLSRAVRSFLALCPSRCFSFPFCFSLHLLHSRHFLSLSLLLLRPSPPPLSPLLSPKRDRAKSEAGGSAGEREREREEKYAGEFGKNELKGGGEELGTTDRRRFLTATLQPPLRREGNGVGWDRTEQGKMEWKQQQRRKREGTVVLYNASRPAGRRRC